MKQFLKRNWVLILGIIIATIMNAPHLIPSYYLDGYCSLCEGFDIYALTFVKAGRYLTAGIYYLVNFIKLSPAIFSTVSIILANIILSTTMQIIYNDIILLTNKKNDIKTKLLIFFGAFLICFNPFNIEFLLFEESFAICLGFLTSIYAGSIYFKNNKNSFTKTLLMLFISSCFYQGTLSLFLPYVFLLTCIKNKNINIINNIKKNYKFYINGLICYGLSLALSFLGLKIIVKIFDLKSQKFGELNILTNIKIIASLLIDTLRHLFNMINSNYYYASLFYMFILYIGYVLIKFKKNYSKLFYVILMILLCLATTFVPNLAMNSLANYTAARMACSIGAINGFILLLSLLFDEKTETYNYLKNLILIIGLSVTVVYFSTYLNSANDNLYRYREDTKFISNIHNEIKKYEIKNKKIDTIHFAISSSVNYHYTYPFNSINLRVNAIDWGIDCILKNTINKKLTITKKEENEILKLDLKEGLNYKYLFDKNTLYLLIW